MLAASAGFIERHHVLLSRMVDVMAQADAAFARNGGPLDESHPAIASIAFVTGLKIDDVVSAIVRYRPPPLSEQASTDWLRPGGTSRLVEEMRIAAEVWAWAGRSTGQTIDLGSAIDPRAAETALGYQR